MAFLVGSTGDPRFWHAREIILSSSPHFLLTLGTLENNQEAATTSLIENEGFLLLRPPVDFLRVSQLILHLLSVLASTNFISVDLSDLVTVLGGAHLEWSVYQTAMSKDLRGYASFLEDSVERIRESKLVFALVCFDDPRSTFLSDVDRALEPLDRLVRDDAAIVFLTDWTAFDEVAFEVHLVVIEKANSPSKPGQLPRVI